MTARLAPLLLAATAALFAACASTKIPRDAVAGSQPEAQSLIGGAQRAHGGASFHSIRDLNVRQVAKWGALAPRLQPKLTDARFRRESEEALDLATNSIVQLHTGRGGRKFVARQPGRVAVWYNGQPDDRLEVNQAAALVADISRMCLLGPFYFQRPGVTLATLGTDKVDGAACDRVLAVLRPGFGFSNENRVVLSIDRQTSRLRRVRTTLHGLDSTRDAELEVTFSDWGLRGGVWWATQYRERFRAPFNLHARRWTLVDLKYNRGFAPRQPEMLGEVAREQFRAR